MTTKSKQFKAFFNLPFTKKSSFEKTSDGGLIVHNIVAMAPGIWEAMQGMKTRFRPEIIERDQKNWQDNGAWQRHPGGSPRCATDLVGAVINPHYEPSIQSEVVDVKFHCKSAQSQACAEIVQIPEQEGGIKSVSAETLLETERIPNSDVLDVTRIFYTGLAFVRTGSCESCKIPAFSGEKTAVAGGGIHMPKDKTKANLEEEEEEEEEQPPTSEPKQEPSSPGGSDKMDQVLEGVNKIAKMLEGMVGGKHEEEEEEGPMAAYRCHEKKIVALEKELADLKLENSTLSGKFEKLAKSANPLTVGGKPDDKVVTMEATPGIRMQGRDLHIER